MPIDSIRPKPRLGLILAATVAIVASDLPAFATAPAPSAAQDGLFQRLDADGDGALSETEIAPEDRNLFQRLMRRADDDGDGRLSHDEFRSGLVPSRPEKPLEKKQPSTLPQADAVRYVLLTMDTTRDSIIDAEEVPPELLDVFDALTERVDRNNNDTIERQELDRAGQVLSAVAGRYVQRHEIDPAAELKKLARTQRDDFDRFERRPIPFDQIRDPKQARKVFKQLDTDRDGYLESKEIPQPLQQSLERFWQLADRDRDRKLSEREFLVGAERLARFRDRSMPTPEKKKPIRSKKQTIDKS